MLYGEIKQQPRLYGELGRDVIEIQGGSIDETEFNKEYVIQMDLVSNILEGDAFVDYTEDEILAMENTLRNISRGGVFNG